MLCSSGSERPCGVCRDCRKVKAHIHPDLTLIERKTDDKGNLKKEITVDQVREMGADATFCRTRPSRRSISSDRPTR